jgi:hypothetical protein
LSASGLTGSFNGELGLTNEKRRDTAAFQEFEKLITMYRNNGSVYDARSSQIVAQGFVVMNYDSAIYQGFFESFSIDEVNDKQFNLQYQFSFKVTQEVFPGRMQSFKNITMVPRQGAPINDNVTLDITTLSGTQS